MTELAPLVTCWLLGAVLLLLDGRKPVVLWGSVLALGSIAVFDVVLVLGLAMGREPLEVVTGGWPAGIGIRLEVDLGSAFFSALCALVLVAALAHEARVEMRSRLFPAFVFLLAGGLHGAFVTRDLFNFYVFFELSVMASFALSAYGYGRGEVRGAFNYVAMNVVGSLLFLTGVASAYHATGTLDFAEMAARASALDPGSLAIAASLIFAGFSVKLGLFPFHGWVPVLYSHAQPSVATALGGALVNIGAYGMMRIGFGVMDGARASAAVVLVVLGLAAMLYGAALGLRRERPAEVAAYTAIVHAGYIVLALGLGGPYAVTAIVLTALAGSLDKSMMFLSSGAGGTSRRIVALIAAASVAGIPLTAGFLAKVALFRAAVDGAASIAIVVAFALVAIVIVACALRFERVSRAAESPRSPVGRVALAVSVLTVGVGVAAEPLVGLAGRIGDAIAGGAS